MTTDIDEMSELLALALQRSDRAEACIGQASRVDKLKRLSGGANMETWALDWQLGEQRIPLILRRLPSGKSESAGLDVFGQLELPTEAKLVQLAGQHGVAVADVVLVLSPEQDLGVGYLMTREQGEALPKRILKDEKFALARQKLAGQCGEILARIHQLPLDDLPSGLSDRTVDQRLEGMQASLDRYGNSSPVLQLGLNWLREHQPGNSRRCLVHGDFRNGNLLVDENGVTAVLDWELAHIGDPVEDLGYICANVWRFGNIDKPVGGFGDYRQLLDGYESVTGYRPDMEAVIYWEAYAALSWGLVCQSMLEMYRNGLDRSMERAAIGRRMSEAEIDLLLLLDGRL